ncbi:hypothetical protein C8R41DRAFT_916716 [Lentinula lateritia]|uniref:GATA-type domain-containing protein n=1 Tax=Lentinula lateritia TaxID=40482 RepID=A0ABQ8VS73_9AGAR|nr:hypothetical protein C8R41DRAFT_916716 [Lentinula lateritia]
MALTKDSSERESRPPSGQSNKTGSRRPSPARGVTPPLNATETLASLRGNEASAQQKDAEVDSRTKSKTPPGPQPTYQQQHYYPYPPPPPPPHMYSVSPYESSWGRMMPPPLPPASGDRGRDPRGSESPVAGGSPGYPQSGMPGYPHPHHHHHHQGHHPHPHDPYPPLPHHYAHSAYPYGNPNGVHMPVYPVQTSYTYNPAGITAYGSHPPPYSGPGGHGTVGSNYSHNGAEPMNIPPSSESDSNIHSIGPGAPPSVPGNGFAAITATLTPTPIPESEIIYTEDAATKVTDRIRRRCYNCYTSDTSTWRRSNLAVGKVLCNKCGLFERTHSRPRPEQFPHKRTSLGGEGEGNQSPSSPSYSLTPVPSQSPLHSQDTSSRPVLPYRESNGTTKRNKKAKLGHGKPESIDSKVQSIAPVPTSSSGSPPGPVSALHVPSQANANGLMLPTSDTPPNSHHLPVGLANLTHPHPPQHQPYYGNQPNSSPHPSSYPTHPSHSSHTMYAGGAFGVPLQYNGYPSSNGFALPPIGGPALNGYEYTQPHNHSHQQQQQHSGPPPPQRASAPVSGLQGLLNGVDGRGRDSRESSAPAPFRKSSDVPIDPSLNQSNDGMKENDQDNSPSRRNVAKELDMSPSEKSGDLQVKSKSATSKSPTKSSTGTRVPRKSGKPHDDSPPDSNAPRPNGVGKATTQRDASPESASDYHSSLSDGNYADHADEEEASGSGDDYTSEGDDDDGSGDYKISRSRDTKGTRGRPIRSVAKRQTRMSSGVVGGKRKRSLRGTSPAGDD